MKAATVHELKQELKNAKPAELVELCLRLARFKKENKELLTFLLFEAHDLGLYVVNVKEDMDHEFTEVNTRHVFFAKKTVRKILRTVNKYIRYTGSKTAEAELLLHYCTRLKELNLPMHKSTSLTKLYHAQLKKAATAIDSLHEDLQYEYRKELDKL
jgi:hypothetical protein